MRRVVVGLAALLVASFALCGLSRRADPRAMRVGLLATTCLALVFLTTEYQSKAPWYLMAGAFTILHLRRIAAFSHVARASTGRGA